MSAFILVLGLRSQSRAQSAAPITAETVRRIDALFAAWDNTRSPGCALGVSQKGTLVYSRGYGMSNLEYDIPITADSIFDIGSVSKQFVAFSIALLASDGNLSLDDDMRRYVPETPNYGQKITIRHLLTHTSGLRDVGALLGLAGWRVSDGNAGPAFAASPLLEPVTIDDVLRMAARQKSLDFMPGAEFHYNNTGYKLLAVIVERVSGQSLRDFAEARIFRPLNMRDTQFLDDPGAIVRRHASAYQPTPSGGWRTHGPFSRPWALGSSGVHTTVGDLLKWEENFVTAGGRERDVLDEMQTSGRLNDGTSTKYGFGLNIGIRRDLRTVGHGGDSMGYLSEVVRYPDQHLAISVLCNASTIYPRPLADKVAEIVLGLGAPAPVARPVPAVAVAEAELAALVGTYWSSTMRVLRFTLQGGRLLNMEGEPLTPLGAGRFRVGERPDPILFPAPKAGSPQEMHILAPGRTIVLSRAAPPSYSAAELNAYAGEYRSEELGVTYKIVVTPERTLSVLREKVDPVPLMPLTLDTFYGQSLGFTLTFSRPSARDVTGFTITAPTPRQLSFTRVALATSAGSRIHGFRGTA
jgi:CubicO group peptidase (beta-lactamase class C family)